MLPPHSRVHLVRQIPRGETLRVLTIYTQTSEFREVRLNVVGTPRLGSFTRDQKTDTERNAYEAWQDETRRHE